MDVKWTEAMKIGMDILRASCIEAHKEKEYPCPDCPFAIKCDILTNKREEPKFWDMS